MRVGQRAQTVGRAVQPGGLDAGAVVMGRGAGMGGEGASLVDESRRDGTRGVPSSHEPGGWLMPYLDDPESRWSLGGFGAGAEFGHAPGEPVTKLGAFARASPRGAIRLDGTGDCVPVAYETGFRDGWSHAVALCRPVATGLVRGADGVTALGSDAGAVCPQDRETLLFDLGIGLPQGWVAVRTRESDQVAALSAACGASAFAQGSPVAALLLERAVDVVVVTPLGRIEVFAGRDTSCPGGPRAFVVPAVLRLGRTHAATAPIPPGLVPCAHLHPPHPCRDARGRPIPFDTARHAAFQALLMRWGDPDGFVLKRRLLAGETLPRDADRRARAVARVATVQGLAVRAGPEARRKVGAASSRDGPKSRHDTTS